MPAEKKMNLCYVFWSVRHWQTCFLNWQYYINNYNIDLPCSGSVLIYFLCISIRCLMVTTYISLLLELFVELQSHLTFCQVETSWPYTLSRIAQYKDKVLMHLTELCHVRYVLFLNWLHKTRFYFKLQNIKCHLETWKVVLTIWRLKRNILKEQCKVLNNFIIAPVI